MKRLFVLLLVLALPLPVLAEIYSWTDANGTVHFTEDISSVPKQYRKKLNVRDGGAVQPPVTESVSVSRPDKAANPAPVAGGASVVPAGKAANGTYGGKSAAAWQAEFREKRAALQAVEAQIAQLQAEMTSTKELITPAKAAALNARRNVLSQQYEAAAASLNRLVEQANQAGLPPEFAK